MLKKGDILLLTGDSITDCDRNREEDNVNINSAGWGYANLLKSALLYDYPHLGLTIYNRGIAGNRSVDLYARAKEDCYNLRPSIVSILIGVNDLWGEYRRRSGVDAEKFRKIYDLMLCEAREQLPNVKFVLLEPFSLEGVPSVEDYDIWRAELAVRQGIVKELAAAHGAVFVPLQAEFDAACAKAPATYWLYDGVHPTEAGHMLIAHAWQRCALGTSA